MADDVDDLLRRAMKTLDDQVPSGYFEGLPSRTLARLEGQMQTTGGSGTESDKSATGAPPPKEEDSGLHDIRSLASSTKARLSSRRSSQNPIVPDDDILASSSAGWKAVALPEPAKMVSLPELAELPSKREIRQAEKAAAESAPAVTPIGSRIAQPKATGKKKGPMLAIAGIGLAAAAGAAIFIATGGSKDEAKLAAGSAAGPTAAPTVAMEQKAENRAATTSDVPARTPAVEPIPDPQQAMAQPQEAAGSASGAGAAAPAPQKALEGQDKNVADSAKAPKHKPGKAAVTKVAPPPIAKTPDKLQKEDATRKPEVKGGKPGDKKSGETEPSFDDLLKEAGVNKDQKTDTKPKLAKKSLSGDDIKHGMSAVAAKAQACYAGQQGTAAVKLTVSPDGRVEKVKVTGAFAGTPVGACVEAAVKNATFPPWDGGPQSFGYSYLLSE